MKLRLAGVLHNSVVDGPGLRSVVFTQGCPHHCPGCHNLHTQDPAGGDEVSVAELAGDLCSRRGGRGVTLSGGEPFAQAGPLAALAAILRENGRHILIYTGYTFEELLKKAVTEPATAALLAAGDLLIDGRFILAERDLSLPYRGSRNQRILDLQDSLKAGEAVLSVLHTGQAEQRYG